MLGFSVSSFIALALLMVGIVLTTTPDVLATNWAAWQAAYPLLQGLSLEKMTRAIFAVAALFGLFGLIGGFRYFKRRGTTMNPSASTHGAQSPVVQTGDNSPVSVGPVGSYNTTNIVQAQAPLLPWYQQGGAPQLTCDNPQIDERGRLAITFRLTGTPPPVNLSGKWEGIVDEMEWITQTLGDQGQRIMEYPADMTKFTMRGTAPNVASDRALFRLRFNWGDGYREIQQEFDVPNDGQRRQLVRRGAPVPLLIADD